MCPKMFTYYHNTLLFHLRVECIHPSTNKNWMDFHPIYRYIVFSIYHKEQCLTMYASLLEKYIFIYVFIYLFLDLERSEVF